MLAAIKFYMQTNLAIRWHFDLMTFKNWDNWKLPVLRGITSIVDDLTSDQAGVAVEDLDGLRVTLHAPVVHARLGDKCDLENCQKINILNYDLIWLLP